MGYLADTYKKISALDADAYQFTMPQAFFDQDKHETESAFYMFWRKPAHDGGYTVAAGLEGVIDFIENFKIDDEDLAYLKSKKDAKGNQLYSDEFLDYLQNMEFSCTVDAVPEGSVVFPQEPVIRIKGPLIQTQMIESAVLNIINGQSSVATKASRIVDAVGEDGSDPGSGWTVSGVSNGTKDRTLIRFSKSTAKYSCLFVQIPIDIFFILHHFKKS